jgi:hypothetical protein
MDGFEDSIWSFWRGQSWKKLVSLSSVMQANRENERADCLAGMATVKSGRSNDQSDILQAIREASQTYNGQRIFDCDKNA